MHLFIRLINNSLSKSRNTLIIQWRKWPRNNSSIDARRCLSLSHL